jgi:NOL1/NOP2/fmu family ribosome biogenesis protein
MKISIMDRAKKKKLIAGLSDMGMKKIPQLLVKSGKERIRAYSGDLSTEQIMEIWRLLPIEGVGLYVGKDMINRNGVHEIRMSLDGMHLWKEQLTERVFQLTEEQEEEWFKGKEVELTEEQIGKISDGFVNVKSFKDDDFVGMGKIGSEGKILYGFLPKERRRKSQTL